MVKAIVTSNHICLRRVKFGPWKKKKLTKHIMTDLWGISMEVEANEKHYL